jgi:putative sterol carrier protein
MDKEINQELISLESERRMGEVAIKAHQNTLSAMLNGSMGQDINDVLSGKKKVKLTFMQKVKYKIYNFFKLFNGGDNEYGI